MRKNTDSKKSTATRQYIKSLLASTALVSAGVAYAQSDASELDKAVSNERGPIEEVVVRGVARQYRPEESNAATGLNMKLIDTPQSISVLTTEMMDTIGAGSIYDATDLVPGAIKNGFGFGSQRIFLRGLVDATFHRINGLESSRQSTSIEGYMLDRVEVVRGPATVIYGVTGAFGGEINHVLKRPEADGHTQFGFEYGNYDSQSYKFDTTGTLPGTDEAVRGRLTVKYDDLGLPYDIENFDITQEKATILASVAWDITPQTTATVWYYHQDRDGDPVDGGGLAVNPDSSLALPQDVLNVDPDTWYFSHPEQSDEDYSTDLFLAEIAHTFDNDWRLKAEAMVHQFDYENELFFGFGPFGHYGLADDQMYLSSYNFFRDNKELTFNLSLGGDFEMFGREHSFFAAFEHKDNLDPENRQKASQFVGFIDLDTFADGNFDGVQPLQSDGTPHVPIGRDLTSRAGHFQDDTTDYKGSFQILLRPFDRVEILGGVLVHEGDLTRTEFSFGGTVFTPPNVTEVSFTEVVPRGGITYDLLDDWQYIDDAKIYFSYSEGFEPQIVTDNAGNQVFLPRTMKSYEVGAKAEFLDGAVGASIAYYNYNVKNIRTSASFLGNIALASGSQGQQDGEGVEFELVGELLPGWNMAFNYTYFDGKIFSKAIDPATGTLQFPFTATPRSTPDHSAVMTTSYEFLQGPLDGLRIGGTLKISGDYAYNDSLRLLQRFTPAGQTPASFIDGAHQRLDLNLSYRGFTGALDGLNLYFNITNVFDEEILVQKESHPGFASMFIDRRLIKGGFTYSFD